MNIKLICSNCNNQSEVIIIDDLISLCPDCKRKQSINDDSIEKWIVFWRLNTRIGSIRLNKANWKKINRTFIYNIIQTDITGTVHIDLLGLVN